MNDYQFPFTTTKIGPLTIDIVISDSAEWASGGMGRMDLKRGRMVMCKGMPPSISHNTYIHELTHFIAESHNLNLNDEVVINVLANGFHDWLLQNKDIVRHIIDEG